MLITRGHVELNAYLILFFQTSNGQVEAKVQCYYRKRDLSSALAIQSEKHLCKYDPAECCTLLSSVVWKLLPHFGYFPVK